ncbi:Enoyl-[acyl-carrier-protein] reductase (FMN) [Rubellimicrobium mesophilum DSM 19309]|uniref:Enoyl-[acyl-carrier-protein] reductase (FMN) n=2 Tax=Rubellimicrobium TaxID=295418 RepID=A0A017HUJ7_9RHOB|nr:Enoyl-[acyl-carrier-protein] reductase (FMN) [Rubellimicrobium mesophilum DSM 19309]
MGGPARHELAAAVARAGGFGMLGMVRESPDLIEREVAALRTQTNRPFAVNLIPAATDRTLLRAEMDACLDLDVPAFTFFWDPVPEAIARAKAAGALVLHQVGSLQAAREAEAAGADVLIAQGVEAGGHVHGTSGALVLTEQVAREAKVPVVASGGFATGAGLVAALALGAQGIQCGTAFLATRESYAHDYHKQRLVGAGAEDTVFTDAYVINWPKGAPVRVLRNSVIDALGHRLTGHDPADLPREVVATDDGRPLLRQGTDSPLRGTEGDLEAMALYAGQSTAFVDAIPSAEEVIDRIVAEAEAALDRLASLTRMTEQTE